MLEVTANPSPLFSEIFSLVALLLISGLVFLIIRHYLPIRTTPAYYVVPIFLALALPASIILLVPIDLASNARDIDSKRYRGIWLPSRVILISWRIVYWETFLLTWFILPILAEYADAGYREPKARLMWSLKRNLVYYGMLFGSGFLGMIYFFISSGASLTTLKGILMATAYFWGLIIAIYLMGHGLIAIPRKLFQNANLRGKLERSYIRAAKVHEKMTDSIQNLEDLQAEISELSRRKTQLSPKYQDWIEELVDDSHVPYVKPRSLISLISSSEINVPSTVTETYMADLSRNLCRAHHSLARYLDEWNRVVEDASKEKNIVDALSTGYIDDGKSLPDATTWERFTLLSPRTRFFYECYLLPYSRKFLGIFFSMASFCIIWSELVKPINPLFSIIRVTVIHHPNSEEGEIGIGGQLIAVAWIFYMCFAALISLTELKVWRGRALVRRNTHGESAMWYSYQVTRLSVPLAFNFITFLDPEIYKQTVFYQFLGNLINLTPLSSWFDTCWPIFIVVPVCATLFGLYSKIHNCIGYGGYIAEEEQGDTSMGYEISRSREGRELIEREQFGIISSSRQTPNSLARPFTAPTNPYPPLAPAQAQPNYPAARQYNTTSSSLLRLSADSQRETHPIIDEDNLFGTFGHKLKNTVQTIQTPRWLLDVSENIKIPQWIGGNIETQTTTAASKISNWVSGNRHDRGLRL
ncbi:hypothetical protein K3495_g6255 [Podosphaera aphanis]|nr:hypothetical protein K3495_g6255 [Podosphaera aphanis]